jgi:hypothetical protein
MGMLLNPKYADIIAFLSDERRFIIVNPLELETNVLPLYAEELGGTGRTYQQFIEILCDWGFQINYDEKYPDINVYSHPKFSKGNWDSCLQIEMVGGRNVTPSEATLLKKMEASRASRRLSGVGLNEDYFDMRSYFLRTQMAKRLSLPTPAPQSMLIRHKMKMKAADFETCNVGTEKNVGDDGKKEDGSTSQEKSGKKEITMDSDKIVAEAMAALNKPFRRHSIDHNMNPSQLNAMTEEFLQRSMSRRLSTLPMLGPRIMYGGAMNSDLMKEVGAKVDAQAKVLFAQRRRSSLAMQQQHPVMQNGVKGGSADGEPQNKEGAAENVRKGDKKEESAKLASEDKEER